MNGTRLQETAVDSRSAKGFVRDVKTDADLQAIRAALSAIDNARVAKGYKNLDDLARAARVSPRAVHYWRDNKKPTTPKYAVICKMLGLVGLAVKIVPFAEVAAPAAMNETGEQPLWRERADVLVSRLADLDEVARGAALGRFEDAIEKAPPRSEGVGERKTGKQLHGNETIRRGMIEAEARNHKSIDSVRKIGVPAPTSLKTKQRKRHP